MGRPYVQRFDGEWVDVTAERCLACCDCGLIHDEEYRIIEAENGNEHIIRRVMRDNRATAARRRSMKAKNEGIFSAHVSSTVNKGKKKCTDEHSTN